MVDDRQKLELKKVMEEIRTTFARGDWNEAIEAYDGAREMFKGERGMRLEAACLAARAWTALKDRSKARALLKPLTKAEYKRPAHYEFLARAFLDLKQYDDASKVCKMAHDLRQAEPKK